MNRHIKPILPNFVVQCYNTGIMGLRIPSETAQCHFIWFVDFSLLEDSIIVSRHNLSWLLSVALQPADNYMQLLICSIRQQFSCLCRVPWYHRGILAYSVSWAGETMQGHFPCLKRLWALMVDCTSGLCVIGQV